MLLDGKRQPGHVRAAFTGKIEREAAPAGADIEHLVSRADQQLCRDVPPLVQLRGVEIVRIAAEIGAGILTVLVEEQIVEPIGQIVVMGYVPAGTAQRIVLVEPAQRAERTIQDPSERALGERFDIHREQIDKIVKVALFDRKRPFHKGFAEIEARPRGEFPMESWIMEPDRDARPRAPGNGMNRSAGVHDAEPADGDDPLEQTRQQHRHETE